MLPFLQAKLMADGLCFACLQRTPLPARSRELLFFLHRQADLQWEKRSRGSGLQGTETIDLHYTPLSHEKARAVTGCGTMQPLQGPLALRCLSPGRFGDAQRRNAGLLPP